MLEEKQKKEKVLFGIKSDLEKSKENNLAFFGKTASCKYSVYSIEKVFIKNDNFIVKVKYKRENGDLIEKDFIFNVANYFFKLESKLENGEESGISKDLKDKFEFYLFMQLMIEK